jgi:ribosome-associated protein
MIQVTPNISIDESEFQEEFIRSSGPGGQNVNKVTSAVELRFNVYSASLSEKVRQRLIKLAGNRMTQDGTIIIDARRFRSQSANRQAAIGRLCELIRKADLEPQIRYKTRPTLSSKKRRLDMKHQHSEIKKIRRQIPDAQD